MKPKCPKCGGSKLSIENGGESPWVVCECQWQRRVSRAAIIRLAVEPKKPETCEWVLPSVVGDIWTETQCERAVSWQTDGVKFCFNCGKPVEVVNG